MASSPAGFQLVTNGEHNTHKIINHKSIRLDSLFKFSAWKLLPNGYPLVYSETLPQWNYTCYPFEPQKAYLNELILAPILTFYR